MQFSSPIEHGPLQGFSKSPGFRPLSPTSSNHLSGLTSIFNPQASKTAKIAPIGKEQGRGSHMEHIFSNANSANEHTYQQTHPLPEPKLGHFDGTIPSFGPSRSNGSGMETLSGPQFLWGSPRPFSERTTSPAWHRPAPAVGNTFTTSGKDHAFPFSVHHGSFLGSSPHHYQHQLHHHAGSAPSGIPLERSYRYFSESPETSFLSSIAYGGIGLGPSDGKLMANMGPHAATSAGISIPGNISENGTNFKMMSSPRLSPVLLGNGPFPGLHPTNVDGMAEHGQNRRVETNGNQIDIKKQFQLDLDKIVSGDDDRTTLMIKNIPNK